MIKLSSAYLILILLSFLFIGCKNDLSPPLSPADEKESFSLASGLRIELVASEPLVQEPVIIQFDRKGRLWVVEMRGFMQNIDGTDEDEPIGRVSVLLDDDNDGKMDRSVVYADSLVLPRALAFVEDGVLIAEDAPLWLYKDLDGDLIADKRVLIDSVYGKKGNVEHSPNGLLRGLDGWLYNAKSDARYKKIEGIWVKEKTGFRGQWGISKDNVGRLYYNYNWSQLHADLVPPNYLNRNPHHSPTTGIDVGLTVNRHVFPIRPNLAANRGYLPETLDEEGRIKEFTSACSPFVYRGDLLPESYVGNVFVAEPVGNLVKRNIVFEEGYQLRAEYAYNSTEFLASTDERFRPVSFTSGPDGALYITDMYHGIIEHGPYITPYLRDVILKRKLTEPIHCGRIWRVVPEDTESIPVKDLTKLNSDELVDLFRHKNGWYRDQAQQLLIEQGDPSVFELLEDIIKDQSLHFTSRIHALWTLYEMDYPNHESYFDALSDTNDHVKALAIRLLEKLVRADEVDDVEFGIKMIEMSAGNNPVVNLQIALSASSLSTLKTHRVLTQIINRHFDEPLMRDAVLSSLTNEEMSFMQGILDNTTWESGLPGRAIFIEMLATAVARKSDTKEVSLLMHYLAESENSLNWKQKAVLEGMSLYAMEDDLQPVNMDKKPLLIANIDTHEVSVKEKINNLEAMFIWPGKETVAQVRDSSRVQVDPEQFAYGRMQYLNVCAGCHGNDGKGMNRFAPPLRNSEWVLGSEKRLALLLIHGMQGPLEVAGKEYGAPDILPEMPSFSVYDDRKLAAIMTYIRTEWGNQAEPVSGGSVAGYRVRGQGKLTPWTAEELLKISDDPKNE